MKQYKLIAMDVDGTLMNREKEVSPGCREALREASEHGKILAYATGRAMAEMRDLFEMIPEIRYAIFSSGAGIYDRKTGKFHRLRSFSPSVTDQIMEIAARKDVMPQIVTAEQVAIQRDHMERLDRFHMEAYRPMYEKAMTLTENIFSYYERNTDPILKISLYHRKPEDRIRTREEMREMPLETAFAEASSLECSPRGVHKGSGLAELCEELEIRTDECIAVGDAENDLTMIRTAGLGVAMGNAVEAIRQAADRIVSDNDQDGCAEAIRFLTEINTEC